MFVQWDNASDRMTANARLHWALNAGSDAYLAWNGSWPITLDDVPWTRPERNVLVRKLVYYFDL